MYRTVWRTLHRTFSEATGICPKKGRRLRQKMWTALEGTLQGTKHVSLPQDFYYASRPQKLTPVGKKNICPNIQFAFPPKKSRENKNNKKHVPKHFSRIDLFCFPFPHFSFHSVPINQTESKFMSNPPKTSSSNFSQ